jgi:8-oxo-dGTP pyrophosphatase MutT (NUDIX family)
LQRELFEELSVRIDKPVPYRNIRHEYPEKTVEIHFFHCTIEEGRAMPIECAELRWVLPHELPLFRFPPADQTIIAALQREAARSSL